MSFKRGTTKDFECRMPELLAPVGNFECLKAAIAMGADAVYLSGKKFGARSYADNFDEKELKEAVRYSHLRGVFVHVTVNTLVADKEIFELKEYLKFLDSINVDALIIQDLGVLSIAQELGVNADFHASTQLTVHNLRGAISAKELGFNRVVLSRELPLSEIKYITENCDIETEIFVHGAMCMSYSGQCLMSSALGGRSGNRGKCAQPCRQAYSYNDQNEKFCLSLKDMSLISRLDELSGVSSLKIEGRMKGPAYVGLVVKTYRDCITDNRNPSQNEIDRLNSIFFRGGQTSGYFDKKLGTHMFAFNKPDNPYLKGGKSLVKEISDDIKSRMDNFKIEISGKIDVIEGEKIRLEINFLDKNIICESCEVLDTAKSLAIDKERIFSQISKTGSTIFEFVDIEINIKGNPFVPIKELNEIRRIAFCEIEQAILDDFESKPKSASKDLVSSFEKTLDISGITATIRTVDQYNAIKEFEKASHKSFALIGVPIHVLLYNIDMFIKDRDRIVIEPPVINHDSGFDDLTEILQSLFDYGFVKIRANNISDKSFTKMEFTCLGSFRLNITNTVAADVCVRNLGFSSSMLSSELSIPQIRDIAKNSQIGTEVCVYGFQPLMVTENCIIKNLSEQNCPCTGEAVYMTDRLKKKFPIIKDGNSCRSVLLNSVPVFMADRMEDLYKTEVDFFNLSFTIENYKTVKDICRAYFFKEKYDIDEFTRLHFYRGINKFA